MIEDAKVNYPAEICGVIVNGGNKAKYFKCKNIAPNPEDEFVIDPMDYIRASQQGDIIAIVHSHPDNTRISNADREGCNKSGIPWTIVDATSGTYTNYYPEKYVNRPFIGRPFIHGILDCYALVKDYYKKELNIELEEYYRPEAWWEDRETNLYLDNAFSAGFIKIESKDLRKGDIVLMKLRSPRHPNHAAIYMGDGTIMHHVAGRLSKVDPYGGYWLSATHSLWRYNG